MWYLGVSMEKNIEFLKIAYNLALLSPDPSTQNGAIVVSAEDNRTGSGPNRFPDGVNILPDRLLRPKKYEFMEHAERYAIFQAAKDGIKLDGATIYVCWAACASCARAIICSGIKKVVTDKRTFDMSTSHWQETIGYAYEMFAEAKIEVEFINEYLGVQPILLNGQLWQP